MSLFVFTIVIYAFKQFSHFMWNTELLVTSLKTSLKNCHVLSKCEPFDPEEGRRQETADSVTPPSVTLGNVSNTQSFDVIYF